MRIALATVVYAAIAACGGSSSNTGSALPQNRPAAEPTESAASDQTPESPADTSHREAIELALGVIAEMAHAAADTAGNCAAMADSLASVAGANRELWRRLHSGAGESEHLDATADYRDQLGARLDALISAIGPCLEDPGVRFALEQMSGP